MTTGKWKPFSARLDRLCLRGRRAEDGVARTPSRRLRAVPGREFVSQAFAGHPKLKGKLDAERTAAALQSAWRAYHRGDFAAAVAEGTALGLIGANVANKAANIYGTYLETDSERKREIFLQSAARAEALQAAAPDFVNAYYFHAQALGRYSQEISVVKALAQEKWHLPADYPMVAPRA